MKTNRSTLIAAALLALVPASPAWAHDTWIVMQDYVVRPAAPAVLTIVSSHLPVAPAKDALARDRVAKIAFVRPDGTELMAVDEKTEQYRTAAVLQTKGTYLAAAQQQGGFYSKTPDGSAPGKTKKDLPNVTSCRFSEKFAKALFTVGGPGGSSFSRVLGHPMELVPQDDPAALKAGDTLRVKVLSSGKAAANTVVFGTYAGFSDNPGTFAYTTSTDKDGIAKIKLIKNGLWLLLAKEESGYSDPSVCDKAAKSGSLTFLVK
jgi:uncharacterized GH25 family protein